MTLDFLSDINKDHYYTLEYDRVDKFMVKVLWWQAAILALYSLIIYFIQPASFYPNPFSWRVVSATEVFSVIVIGLLTAGILTALCGKISNHYLYRFLMTNAQLMFSYLIVFISGGSIEWHFHFFIMFALLVLYYDWRLGWWAIVVVAFHHGILNYVAPTWVYFYGRNDLSFISHALLVLVMAIFTTKLSIEGRKRAIAFADANKLLEAKIREKLPA